jgi:soluble P-type ATPase
MSSFASLPGRVVPHQPAHCPPADLLIETVKTAMYKALADDQLAARASLAASRASASAAAASSAALDSARDAIVRLLLLVGATALACTIAQDAANTASEAADHALVDLIAASGDLREARLEFSTADADDLATASFLKDLSDREEKCITVATAASDMDDVAKAELVVTIGDYKTARAVLSLAEDFEAEIAEMAAVAQQTSEEAADAALAAEKVINAARVADAAETWAKRHRAS